MKVDIRSRLTPRPFDVKCEFTIELHMCQIMSPRWRSSLEVPCFPEKTRFVSGRLDFPKSGKSIILLLGPGTTPILEERPIDFPNFGGGGVMGL